MKEYFDENGSYPKAANDARLLELTNLHDKMFESFTVNGYECALAYDPNRPFPLIGKISQLRDNVREDKGEVEIDADGKWSARLRK